MDDRTKLIMSNSCDTGQNRCHMTAAATLIAAKIASCKHRVRDLTKPQITSILHLSSGMHMSLQSTRHAGL